MIVITGPGRTGTSLLAQAYHLAGIDPGGTWDPEVRAGYEDPRVWELNREILRQLKVTSLGLRMPTPRIDDFPGPKRVKDKLRNAVPEARRAQMRKWFETTPINSARALKLIDWALIDSVVDVMGSSLESAALQRLICKDPQFCWTLPVWLRAGAAIDHVVITTRRTDHMLASRRAVGHIRFHTESDAHNAMVYALGNSIGAATDHGIAYSILEYPQYTHNIQQTVSQLPLPSGHASAPLADALTSLISSKPTDPSTRE